MRYESRIVPKVTRKSVRTCCDIKDKRDYGLLEEILRICIAKLRVVTVTHGEVINKMSLSTRILSRQDGVHRYPERRAVIQLIAAYLQN